MISNASLQTRLRRLEDAADLNDGVKGFSTPRRPPADQAEADALQDRLDAARRLGCKAMFFANLGRWPVQL